MTAAHTDPSPFYVTGGSLPGDAPSYVARHADEELLDALGAGEFCYVLDTRQVGKSSLLVRTAARLRDEGRRVCVLDLSGAGQSVSAEQWYFGLLYLVAAQLGLDDALEDFWTARAALGPAQRWVAALREVALERHPAPLVVLVDETDAVRSLPFSADEFFAVIRECYNRRTRDPAFLRLTFCLVGVATPAQLIRDTRTTPFNIGRRIELSDFSAGEAAPLAQGLARPGRPEEQARALLARVLFWSGGHPYLTQRLCRTVAENEQAQTVRDVDRLCRATFLTRHGRETDSNLTFARDRMLAGTEADPAAVLALYARVRAGHPPVRYDSTDGRADVLRLAGVASVTGGLLQVRNRLYAQVFDRRWIAENLPGEEVRRQRRAYWGGVLRASLVWVVVLAALLAAYEQNRRAQASRTQAKRANATAHHLQRNLAGMEIQVQHERTTLQRVRREITQTRYAQQQQRRRGAQQVARVRQEVTRAKGRADAERRAAAYEHQAAAVARATAAAARATAQMEQAQARHLGQRVATLSGEIASAFAARPETGVQALDFGVQAVETALQQGRRPPERAVAGLTEAVNAGVLRRLVLSHPDSVLSASFSPDGRRILTASRGRDAFVWDAGTGSLLHRIAVQQRPTRRQLINSAEFSPDGRRLLTAADEGGAVTLWDAPPGVPPRPGRVLQRDAVTVCYAEFSNEGRYVAAIARGNRPQDAGTDIRIHDLKTGLSRRLGVTAVDGERGYLWTISFSHDGTKLVTAGSDGTARVWDRITGKELARLVRHQDPDLAPIRRPGMAPTPTEWAVTSARFLPSDDLVVTTGKDRVARVWRWERGDTLQKLTGHHNWVWNADGDRGGRYVVTAGKDGLVLVWVLKGGARPLCVLGAHTGPVYCARFSPNAQELVTAGDDRTAQVWRFTGRSFSGTASSVMQAALSPDGRRLVTGAADGTVYLADVASGLPIGMAQHPASVRSVAFSPDGRRIAALDAARRVRVYDAGRAVGSKLTPLFEQQSLQEKGEPDTMAEVAFSPDGGLLACAGPGYWVDMRNGTRGNSLWSRRFEGQVVCAAFHPDGKRLLLVSRDNTIEMVDAVTGKPGRSYRVPGRSVEFESKHSDAPVCGAVSPDGRLILIGDSSQRAFLFETETGRLVGTLTGHRDAVLSVAFAPDGRRIATAGADATVRVWEVAQALTAARAGKVLRPLLVVRARASAVNSVRFSPDGSALVTGESDNAAHLYPATLQGYVKAGHALLALVGKAP